MGKKSDRLRPEPDREPRTQYAALPWRKNGDGAVDKAEWTAAGRPAERFDPVDANKDGKITAAELEAAMAAMRQRGG